MAGIGFELKRLFAKKGFLASIRAYGYAGLICAGPMLLGVILLLGVMFLSDRAGMSRHLRELLLSMITYALLASLTVTSFFTMVTTRFTADMIFLNKQNEVMPSFYGSLGIMFTAGGAAYATFLFFAGIPFAYQFLSFVFFMVLIVVWTEITYLTAIKDYRSILVAFAVSLATAFLTGYLLTTYTPLDPIIALFSSVILGYGIMAVWYYILLYRYFPEGFGTSMNFLRWATEYPHLIYCGAFVTFGLFGHLIIMYFSILSVRIQGLFYGAPEHDVAALVAFFSILVTTVNFVTSVEVRFYPQYRNYFSLFNDNGNIGDIENAETNMLRVLKDEMTYLGYKQVITTIIFIIIGSILLPYSILGFNSLMLGIFRVLCAGYAFYAIGNSIMLILLYFADNKGAFLVTMLFAIFTNLCSVLILFTDSRFFGFGFLIGSGIFCFAAYFRLSWYVKRIKFHILCEQPIFKKSLDGTLVRLCDTLEARAEKKQRARKRYYEKIKKPEAE